MRYSFQTLARIAENLKLEYPKGQRVELVYMDDIQAPAVGTQGTVQFVDSIGTIHVQWDNGSTLGVAYGEDSIRKV